MAKIIDAVLPGIASGPFPAASEFNNNTWVFGYPDGSHRQIGVERMARASEMVAVMDGSRVVFS